MFNSNTSTDFSQCLEHVELRVSAEMNSNLLRPFKEEEGCLALSQMHPLKFTGPDGFSPKGMEYCGTRSYISNSIFPQWSVV
jgi:hypothetical protein